MARFARVVIPECPHHITQRGVRSMDIFYTNHDRKIYLDLLIAQGQRFGIKYIGYCLMTNHVHLLAIPKEKQSFALGIGEAHRLYTSVINFREKVRGYLFQGRFFSCPLDDRHAIAALRYMERNPVRAGIVGNAWEYPWSSAAYHCGIKQKDRIVKDSELVERGRSWQELLAIAAKEEGFIRKRSRTGRPCGEKDFMEICEKLTGRNLRPLKPGPRKMDPV